MNVLLLTTHANTGGITSYLLSLSKELVREGHQVHLISSGGNMVGEFLRAGVQHTELDIRTKSELDPKIYRVLGKLTRLIDEHSIDIIHANTRITQVMGRMLGFLTKTVYVATCHGFYKPRWFRRLVPCWGDGVIAISPSVQEHLERDFMVPTANICFIRHGVNIQEFPVASEALRQELMIKNNILGSPVIGVVARLADVKGHAVLIRAMPAVLQEFPNANLVIVGEGKQEQALQNLVAELKLQKQVLFFPVVNQTMEFLPTFDVFVLPSLEEGLGLSVLEAQAAGLPVIASRVGGLVTLIEEGKTGLLVEPNNPKVLSEAILKIVRDLPQARQMGKVAREYIAKEHSSERMTKETVEFYQHLLQNRS